MKSSSSLQFSFVTAYIKKLKSVLSKHRGLGFAGTVEAGAGVGGEGVKRKRSDDMAALEADLAPEPQAGMGPPPVTHSPQRVIHTTVSCCIALF